MKEADCFTVAKDIKREARHRLGLEAQTVEEITPIEALKTYLEVRKVGPSQAKLLLEYGEKLIRGEGSGEG